MTNTNKTNRPSEVERGKRSDSATCSRLEEMSKQRHANHHAKVAARSLSKEIRDLTADEKMSIFIAAGIPTEMKNGRLTTSCAVSLRKIHGKWQVGRSAND